MVAGGSRSYVERLTAPFADRIRVRCPVASVRRVRGGVEVSSETGNVERFDEVVFAVHGDRVLRLLRDPSPREREVLSTFRYARSEAVLHTDTRMLPRCRRARASWNYTLTGETERPALVTYDLSRLQHLDTPRPLMLTLNDGLRVRERHVIRRMACSHPVFDAAVTQAQAEHGTISGRERIHYCGAYWRNGFHEDGVRSAETVAAGLGAGRAAA